MLRVEYLITVDHKEPFCKTLETFVNLMRTIDGLSISKTEMNFKDITVQYEVQVGDIQQDKQAFFHLKLACNDKDLLEFEEVLRALRTLLHRASGKQPHVLWDGVSFNYAKMAYPVVHEIENIMRKLITKFMLINVGIGWAKETIPKEVIESVRSKDAKLDQNYLYEVDFIQLSNFLFKEYSTINPTALIDVLKRAEVVSDLKLEDLKLAIPQSNWDRFFSKIVQCESDYLRVRWERLYERRNQIAHNRPVSRKEYDEICKLKDELLSKLQQAIESLDRIAISNDERELVSENVATAKGSGYSEFLSAWSDLQYHLYALCVLLAETPEEGEHIMNEKNNVPVLLEMLSKRHRFFGSGQHEHILELNGLRNVIVHQPELIVAPGLLSDSVESMNSYTSTLRDNIDQIVDDGIPELIEQ